MIATRRPSGIQARVANPPRPGASAAAASRRVPEHPGAADLSPGGSNSAPSRRPARQPRLGHAALRSLQTLRDTARARADASRGGTIIIVARGGVTSTDSLTSSAFTVGRSSGRSREEDAGFPEHQAHQHQRGHRRRALNDAPPPRRPRWAATRAASSPAGPPPITTTRLAWAARGAANSFAAFLAGAGIDGAVHREALFHCIDAVFARDALANSVRLPRLQLVCQVGVGQQGPAHRDEVGAPVGQDLLRAHGVGIRPTAITGTSTTCLTAAAAPTLSPSPSSAALTIPVTRRSITPPLTWKASILAHQLGAILDGGFVDRPASRARPYPEMRSVIGTASPISQRIAPSASSTTCSRPRVESPRYSSVRRLRCGARKEPSSMYPCAACNSMPSIGSLDGAGAPP